MPLGECGRDMVKGNVAERREPEEDKLDEECATEFDQLWTVLIEQLDPESLRIHLCTGSAFLLSRI